MSQVNDHHALEQHPSTESHGKTNFDGGQTLTTGPSVVDGRRYPRGGDYEAQYFATQDIPDFRKVARIGNPTALPIASFSICLSCASFALMGWGNTAITDLYPIIGVYLFLGGLGMAVGGIAELIIGNAFAYCVFFTFSAYWFAFGSLFNSSFGVAATTTALGAEGARTQGVALAFWQGCFIVLDLIYLIVSLRTNLIFVGIFACLFPTFTLLTVFFGGYKLQAETLKHLAQAAGAFGFITSLLGFYLLLSILLAEVQGPTLPVGDLSGYWAKRSEAKEKKN